MHTNTSTSTTGSMTLVVPPMARGGKARDLQVDVARLSPHQRQVLNMLPRDRKGQKPVLRGPGKTPASMECFVSVNDGELIPADFSFKVPQEAIDDDVPAILEAWGRDLESTRARILERFAKKQAREVKAAAAGEGSAKPKRAKKAKGDTGIGEQGDLLSGSATPAQDARVLVQATVVDSAARPDVVPATQGPAADAIDLDAVNAQLSEASAAYEGGDGEDFGEPGPIESDTGTEFSLDLDWVNKGGAHAMLEDAGHASDADDDFSPAAFERERSIYEVRAEVLGPTAQQDHLQEVFRKIPLMGGVEVECVPGPDAILIDGRSWSALVRVEHFTQASVVTSTLDQALTGLYGQDWRDPELVEDIQLRMDEALQDIAAAHADFVQWIVATKPKPAKQRSKEESDPDAAASEEKGRKRARGPALPPLIKGLVPLMDLARQVMVDLCTSQHAAREIMKEPQAHPDWANEYAEAVLKLEAEILRWIGAADLTGRMALFGTWAEAISVVNASAQLSLWTEREHSNLQRSLVPQVRRAQILRRALLTHPADVGAAVAILCLLG